MHVSGLMRRAAAAAAIVMVVALVMSGKSPAEPAGTPTTGALQAGDVAVTGFSGTMLATDKLAPGVDPIERTFIDPEWPGPAHLRCVEPERRAGGANPQCAGALRRPGQGHRPGLRPRVRPRRQRRAAQSLCGGDLGVRHPYRRRRPRRRRQACPAQGGCAERDLHGRPVRCALQRQPGRHLQDRRHHGRSDLHRRHEFFRRQQQRPRYRRTGL